MDRWILAELDDTISEVTVGLDEFDPTRGGRRLDRFVDDLSNWYVRRSRRRFWRSGSERDTRAAFLTLWECLVNLCRLTAPYTPFVADAIYTNITKVDPDAPDSVHLDDWPESDPARRDDDLRARMAIVRTLVSLGRSARTEAKVRVRQPLARALVVLPAHEAPLLKGLEGLVADELNVKSIEVLTGMQELVTYSVKPNFRALGPRFGARMKEVAAVVAAADPHELVEQVEGAGHATISMNGEEIVLERADLDIRVEGRSGYSLAQEAHYGVALDLDIGEELLSEGIAREVVRGVQDLRKSKGLAVEDRIDLNLGSDDATVRGALEAHEGFIAAEVLATALSVGPAAQGAEELRVDEWSVTVDLRPTAG
jgi:isoleucyl-tRNA synthetase